MIKAVKKQTNTRNETQIQINIKKTEIQLTGTDRQNERHGQTHLVLALPVQVVQLIINEKRKGSFDT